MVKVMSIDTCLAFARFRGGSAVRTGPRTEQNWQNRFFRFSSGSGLVQPRDPLVQFPVLQKLLKNRTELNFGIAKPRGQLRLTLTLTLLYPWPQPRVRVFEGKGKGIWGGEGLKGLNKGLVQISAQASKIPIEYQVKPLSKPIRDVMHSC